MQFIERFKIKLFILSMNLQLIFQASYCLTDSLSQSFENKISKGVNTIKEIDDNLPIITTDLGRIQGKKLLSRDGRDVLAFLGIPYAVPPIGDLRFRGSKEAKPWEGVLNGSNFRDQCSQIYRAPLENAPLGPVGSEDCLYLNIYTPKKIKELKKESDGLPVIVFVHGGVYCGNGSMYGHDYFLDEDVVLITIDFRMHVYANLNTEDGITNGNLGLKDQVLAFKWIRKHISKFGGDPQKVTLFGSSYGSMHITAHLISPMSKGLFQRAIMQSGTIFSPNIVTPNPKKAAFELGRNLGCGNNITSIELVNCLRNIDDKTLTLASKHLDFTFAIESKSLDLNEKNFLLESPISLLKKGKLYKVPLLQGVTSGEGLTMSLTLKDLRDGKLVLNQTNDWNLFFKKYIFLDHVRNSTSFFDKIHQFYFNSSKSLGLNNLDAFVNLMSDRLLNHPLNFIMYYEYLKFKNTTPMFLYYFSKAQRRSFAESLLMDLKIKRTDLVAHGDDLSLFFQFDFFKKIEKGSENYELSKHLVKKYVNFAKYGDPNEIGTNLSISDSKNLWRPFSNDNRESWYEIGEGDRFQMIDPPYNSRMELWNSADPYELYY